MSARNAVLLAVVVAVAGGLRANGPKDDMDKLQGEWALVSTEISGKVVVKGDKWVQMIHRAKRC